MSAFTVTVRTESGQRHQFTAIGRTAIDVHIQVLEEFGICAAVEGCSMKAIELTVYALVAVLVLLALPAVIEQYNAKREAAALSDAAQKRRQESSRPEERLKEMVAYDHIKVKP